jgi:Ser/Thr protein kinase RdoA (MazF antagonist)
MAPDTISPMTNSSTHRPTEDSLPALSEALESGYGLIGPRLHLLQTTMRRVYLVNTDAGDFVLICYRAGADPEAVGSEWKFVEQLAARGVRVAPPLRQSNGELVLSLQMPEAVCHAVLCTYVAGQHLRHRFSFEAVRKYGRQLALLHQVADDAGPELKRPRLDCEMELSRFIAAIVKLDQADAKIEAVLRDAAQRIKARVSRLTQRAPLYGMIHGDVIRANAQVGDDDEVTVLDFDLCGYGWRAYDVASFFQAVDGTAHEAGARNSFLSGYQEVRLLSEEELNAMPTFEAWRHIFALGIPALRPACRDDDFDSADYLKDAVQRLEKVMCRF